MIIPPPLWASVFFLQVENGELYSPLSNLPFQAEICQARSKQLENWGPMLTPQGLRPEKVAAKQRKSFRGTESKETPLDRASVNPSHGGRDGIWTGSVIGT